MPLVMTRLSYWRCAVLFALFGALSSPARAGKLAIFRVDPLGVDPQIVARLEGLLRIEIGRLAGAAVLSPGRLQRLLAANPRLRNCTGEVRCMVRVGRLLGVDRVISGNVGGLAESFVINLKMVDVRKAVEANRIQEPISGDPDQLIEAIRVAAYALVAPERMKGAIAVLADQPAATVFVDGKRVGQTPLPRIQGLKVGKHLLRVTKDGYTDVIQTVRVRFQKTARVVVKLQAPGLPTPRRAGAPKAVRPMPWYTRWWFWTEVAVVAVGTGVGLGFAVVPKTRGIDCSAEPGRCGL